MTKNSVTFFPDKYVPRKQLKIHNFLLLPIGLRCCSERGPNRLLRSGYFREGESCKQLSEMFFLLHNFSDLIPYVWKLRLPAKGKDTLRTWCRTTTVFHNGYTSS
jgi:hypothetical protein